MHQRFVKRLGKPDSIADIKRRNRLITEETQDEEADGEEEPEEEPPPKSTARGKKSTAAKKGGTKLTPMEKQLLDIKRKHLDTLLVIEVGYKFRFIGEDARIAAKELGIVCIPGKFRYDEHPSEAHLDRFASASFPTHRLHVHVKRLVQAGHKVGVVRQMETAALKAAGDNRNTPFVRKLTNLYTKGTYIDDVEEGPGQDMTAATSATGYLLCVTETNAKGWGNDEKVHVGMVAVQPATGDIIYDDFEDGFMRSEIETRLLHLAPCEFLVVGDLSKASDKIVQHLSGSKTNVFGDRARVERIEKPKTMAAQAYSHLSNFYAGKVRAAENDETAEGRSSILDKVHQLTEHVSVCLSAMITHLSEYGLEHVFDLTKYFQPFSVRSHMLLNGNALASLEIYQNRTDNTENGSLFWTVNRTKTRFGRRLLRKWVGRPLLDKAKLEERIAAVDELKEGEHTASVDKLNHVLRNAKLDLEKSLLRIYYHNCSRPELLNFLQTLQRIAGEYPRVTSAADAGFSSSLINAAIFSLPTIAEDILGYLEKLNAQAARDDDKYAFFRDEYETDTITEHKLGIASVEHDLSEHRAVAAEKLKRKKPVDYVTVAGIDFLIEVENTSLKNVPASWAKISGTKKVSRFHTPEVIRLIRERDQHKEALAAACDAAFKDLLTDIAGKYQQFRDCIQSLAMLDCLLSLAEVSSQPGYVKPTFTDDMTISIEGGRHPMIEHLLDTYVPNDVNLSTSSTPPENMEDPTIPRALLITGPNMGGKSSFVRSIALIIILAQIGCSVPATSCTLGLVDGVFTRMGAEDNMLKGESTFMVELSETADILKQATPRSLVILDELGRGTSTFDGVAIASAVLDYVVRELRCATLFITHYQSLARVADSFPEGQLRNVHMRFESSRSISAGNAAEDELDEYNEITFLYEVGEGVAHRSYGLNVARLANVPRNVIDVARVKSAEMEEAMRGARLGGLRRQLGALLGRDDNGSGGVVLDDSDVLERIVSGIEEL